MCSLSHNSFYSSEYCLCLFGVRHVHSHMSFVVDRRLMPFYEALLDYDIGQCGCYRAYIMISCVIDALIVHTADIVYVYEYLCHTPTSEQPCSLLSALPWQPLSYLFLIRLQQLSLLLCLLRMTEHSAEAEHRPSVAEASC